MTRKSGQRSHDEYDPSNAQEAGVFLSYDAVVDRLEDAARRLPGASVVAPDGDPPAGALLLVELAQDLPDEPGILRTGQ